MGIGVCGLGPIPNPHINFQSNFEILNNIDINEKQPRCYRCTGDIMVGLTYLGRIILTLHSFHGLFFVYNIIFQYVILFAAVLYDIKNMFLRIIMTFIYFIFFYCW